MSVALTKAELAEALFEDLGLNKREAKEFVDLFFEEIRGRLEAGKEVKLSGFGNFELRSKNSASGSQPEDGRRDSDLGAPCRDLPSGSELRLRVETDASRR